MRIAIEETERRRAKQEAYNKEHGITPETIHKAVRDVVESTKVAETEEEYVAVAEQAQRLGKRERQDLIKKLEQEMRAAAKELQFERAAQLRDMIAELDAS